MGFFKKDKAFSIIELVVVIIIFSIIALVATLKFGPYDAMKLDAAARKIASDITYAQMLAMTSAYNNFITIDFVSSTQYQIYPQYGFSGLVTNPFTRQDFIVDFTTDTNYKGVTIDCRNFNNLATNPDLAFSVYRGQPQAKVSFSLTPFNSDGKVRIDYKGKKRMIMVTRETGAVRVLQCPEPVLTSCPCP